MNILSKTPEINRRSLFAALPALAAAPMAFAMPDAPVRDEPDLPAWWRELVKASQEVAESGVPHAGAGDRYTVVPKSKLDALALAAEGRADQRTVNEQLTHHAKAIERLLNETCPEGYDMGRSYFVINGNVGATANPPGYSRGDTSVRFAQGAWKEVA